MPRQFLPGVRITPTGAWLGFLGFFLFLAASNTGNNLLYLLVAGLFSLLIGHFLLSIWNLTTLELSWSEIPDGFAGNSHHLIARIRATSGCGGLHLKVGSELLPWLPLAEEADFKYPVDLPRRGLLQIDHAVVTSGFPFGLLRTERLFPPVTVVVYPQPRPFRLALSGGGESVARGLSLDHSGDFWMQRLYCPG